MNPKPFNEEAIIELVGRAAGQGPADLVAGIGDDAAVIAVGDQRWVVTTDLLVEGVHFSLDYMSPADIGHRAMAANLSDIAAMGATPRWGFLSLGLPKPPSKPLVEELLSGMLGLAKTHDLHLAGGDTTAAPVITLNLCLIGQAAGHAGPTLRRGARPGDAICVTGHLGAAMAGLAWLQAGRPARDAGRVVAAHRRPQPRLKAGRAINATGMVTAMMDLSDGLASDLARLAAAGELGGVVESELLPISEETARVARALGANPVRWALSGGEDFELLFTCGPEAVDGLAKAVAEAEDGLAVTRVGTMTEDQGVFLVDGQGARREITMSGYDHFKQEDG